MRKNGKRDLGNLRSVLQLLNSCEESSYFAMVMLNGGPACPEYQYLLFFPFVFIVSIFLFFFFVLYSGCKHVLQIITNEIFYHHNLTERCQCTKSTEVMKITDTMKFY